MALENLRSGELVRVRVTGRVSSGGLAVVRLTGEPDDFVVDRRDPSLAVRSGELTFGSLVEIEVDALVVTVGSGRALLALDSDRIENSVSLRTPDVTAV